MDSSTACWYEWQNWENVDGGRSLTVCGRSQLQPVSLKSLMFRGGTWPRGLRRRRRRTERSRGGTGGAGVKGSAGMSGNTRCIRGTWEKQALVSFVKPFRPFLAPFLFSVRFVPDQAYIHQVDTGTSGYCCHGSWSWSVRGKLKRGNKENLKLKRSACEGVGPEWSGGQKDRIG